MNGKSYTIEPMTDGMFNLAFFEELSEIHDESGALVGYAFVELLPGVRNKPNNLLAFKRV